MQIPPITTDTQTSLWPEDRIRDIIEFLNNTYDIRIPLQDPSKIHITYKNAKRSEFPPSFDDISVDLIADGKSIGDSLLRKILRSPNRIKHCDPIREYFDRIRGQWKGDSQIDLFCKHIVTREFEEYPNCQERSNKLIRKWMVACVACWLDNKHNDVALGFVSGREGIGKTHLAQFLIPKSISEYYIKSSSDERKFDIEDVFTRYMLICFDELVGLNKGNFEEFKSCLSADSILNKRRHEEFPTLKKRFGCALFNSNFNEERGGFIPEYWGTENRRIGTIEISDINREYDKLIDIDQLWSEALSLYENTKFDYKFDKPDYDDFAIYNARYIQESDAVKIVQQYMCIPLTEEEGEKLNPTAILQRLTKHPKIKSDELKKVNAQKIGAALTLLGYPKVSYRHAGFNNAHNGTPLKGYCVKFLE
jgi:hypothetical protein